jgi:hypothetical protein
MRLLVVAAVVVLAGCGAAQKPVEHKVPGGITGFDRLFNLPRGYGVRCAEAMSARRGGDGDGVAVLVNHDWIELATAALRFSDTAGARRAYTAAVNAAARVCYANGFVAELVRRYHVHVHRVETRPWHVDKLGDEQAGTRVTVDVGGRVVHADTAVIRTGSALSFDQSIDVSALGGTDLKLVEALS